MPNKYNLIMQEKRLFAPMLSTFGGGSVRGFGGAGAAAGGGGGGAPGYDFSFTTQSNLQSGVTSTGVLTGSSANFTSASGYTGGSTGYSLTGTSTIHTIGSFANNGNVKYLELSFGASDIPSGTQYVTLKGCRGGNDVDGGYGTALGGTGLTIKAEIDLSALHTSYASGGVLTLIAIGGTRGIDLNTGSNNRGTAGGGGGATALAVRNGSSSYIPLIIAPGGGGGYTEASQNTPQMRPGGPGWLPTSSFISNPNYSTYYQYQYYFTSAGLNWFSPQYGSTDRPWATEGYTGTGSSNGAGWDDNGHGYSSTSSYGAETVKIKEYFQGTNGSISNTPWNVANQYSNDVNSNEVTYATWMGGAGGSYGGGGGGGYFGGFHGGYPANGTGNEWGRSQGGQGYIDTTFITLTSTSANTENLGVIEFSTS